MSLFSERKTNGVKWKDLPPLAVKTYAGLTRKALEVYDFQAYLKRFTLPCPRTCSGCFWTSSDGSCEYENEQIFEWLHKLKGEYDARRRDEGITEREEPTKPIQTVPKEVGVQVPERLPAGRDSRPFSFRVGNPRSASAILSGREYHTRDQILTRLSTGRTTLTEESTRDAHRMAREIRDIRPGELYSFGGRSGSTRYTTQWLRNDSPVGQDSTG